jgi:hypothetical protein
MNEMNTINEQMGEGMMKSTPKKEKEKKFYFCCCCCSSSQELLLQIQNHRHEF